MMKVLLVSNTVHNDVSSAGFHFTITVLNCECKALCEFHCRVNPHALNKEEVI